MKLNWYCGMNADVGDYGTEPTECTEEGVYTLSEHEQQDWADGLTPCVVCPNCGQMLEEPSDYSLVLGENPCAEISLVEWEPPLPDAWFNDGDHVLYEGGVWKVVKTTLDEFDDREQKLDIEWIAGPRMSKMVYATGIRSSDLSRLTDMEVVALAATEDGGL